MPARRRHYPGRGPLTGTAGTRAAYDQCSACGHTRIKHFTEPGPGCSGWAYAPRDVASGQADRTTRNCPCPKFKESEE